MNVKHNKIFYLIFSCCFIVVLLIGYCFLGTIIKNIPDLFSDSSAHYFYSALFQANAAIISILGVFFIFRLQAHQSMIDLIKNGLLADNGRRSWPTEIIAWDGYSLKEKEQLLKNKKTHKNDTCNTSIFDQLSVWTEKERQLFTIKKAIVLPMIFMAVVMIFEAFCLFSATYFHQQGLGVEIFLMYTNLVLESSILVMALYHIISNIKANVV